MAKYADVKAKQRQVDGMNEPASEGGRMWVGFTFKPRARVDDAQLLGYDDYELSDEELDCMF